MSSADAEEAFEHHRALEEAVERVVGREADAGEHLLAVRGDGPRGAPGGRLGERGGHRVRLVAGRGRASASSASTATSASASRWRTAWNARDRAAELHPLERVRAREVEHRPARAGDLVRDRAPAGRDAPLPRRGVDRRRRVPPSCSTRTVWKPASGSMPRTGAHVDRVDRHDRRARASAPRPHTTSSSRRGRRRGRSRARRARAPSPSMRPAASTRRTAGSSTARSARGSTPSAAATTSSSAVAVAFVAPSA